ncbi:MAG TPA: glycosyl hydrolase family 17 [Cytophagales bacterium]|nr:glycosyl hydrolase family 17 [Cytophagales bacterium]HAA21360.1 glycosyl hydrolase family 17 [Cytophagales bacterium]HAP58918.1 glycosyl hydrolase family 17 [Cytophagales bacterium]
MNTLESLLLIVLLLGVAVACGTQPKKEESMQEPLSVTAKEILGNPKYQAVSYGGYRMNTRDAQPTVAELMEDMKILHAAGIRILRTYNVHLPHASNVLKAIRTLKEEDPSFEMYVMLGAWIDCLNAWTDKEPDHTKESPRNAEEIARAIELAQEYPDIVKIIAVGNEAMVHWQAIYWVPPTIILKWVDHLQGKKAAGELPEDLWITCSDDFSSWGGGDPVYHTEGLTQLMHAVDYISMHTYPMHNTHYNPYFWGNAPEEEGLSKEERIQMAMDRSLAFAQTQYDSVTSYMKHLGIDKPIHIGETGWATVCNDLYGPDGSRATDEYKESIFHQMMRDWTNANGISCFYFEAFDESWKDAGNAYGSENHFGLFTVEGQAKYALWDLVDQGAFDGLSRGGNPITKTFGGDRKAVLEAAMMPPVNGDLVPAE